MIRRLARERFSTLVFYGTVLLLAYLLYLLFRPLLTPLAWAATLAAFFFPSFQRLSLRWGASWAALASTVAVAILIVGPLMVVTTLFVQEAALAVSNVDAWARSGEFVRVQRLWSNVQAQFGGRLGSLSDIITQGTTTLTGLVAGGANALLRNVAGIIINLVVTLFALFFCFRDGDAAMAALRRMLPFESEQSEQMIAQARDLIHASVTAGFTVSALQGAIGGVAFFMLGLPAPVFWGVVMAFCALLPVGAGLVWVPAAIWLMLTGSVGRGIALVIVGIAVIGLVDNVLRPLLLSGRTQLNGLLVFVSLIGGLSAFGLLGLVLGPVIMATTIGVLDGYTKDRR